MASNIIHCSCAEGSYVSECSEERLVELGSLPHLNFFSPVSNIPHLLNVDIDVHLPLDTNFGYYTPHDFHGSLSNHKAFLGMHYNIGSLSVNHDNRMHSYLS